MARARRNPSMPSGVVMGNLVELEVLLPNGRSRIIRPKGKLLGWLPHGRQLIVLNSQRLRAVDSIDSAAVKVHKKFHNTNPQHAHVFNWPDPKGPKRNVGRLVSLMYTIPKWMVSPNKKKYRWHHEFGDHGERGHGLAGESGNYPERLMPMLQVDQAGNYSIKRMPGNKFYVTDWLYW